MTNMKIELGTIPNVPPSPVCVEEVHSDQAIMSRPASHWQRQAHRARREAAMQRPDSLLLLCAACRQMFRPARGGTDPKASPPCGSSASALQSPPCGEDATSTCTGPPVGPGPPSLTRSQTDGVQSPLHELLVSQRTRGTLDGGEGHGESRGCDALSLDVVPCRRRRAEAVLTWADNNYNAVVSNSDSDSDVGASPPAASHGVRSRSSFPGEQAEPVSSVPTSVVPDTSNTQVPPRSAFLPAMDCNTSAHHHRHGGPPHLVYYPFPQYHNGLCAVQANSTMPQAGRSAATIQASQSGGTRGVIQPSFTCSSSPTQQQQRQQQRQANLEIPILMTQSSSMESAVPWQRTSASTLLSPTWTSTCVLPSSQSTCQQQQQQPQVGGYVYQASTPISGSYRRGTSGSGLTSSGHTSPGTSQVSIQSQPQQQLQLQQQQRRRYKCKRARWQGRVPRQQGQQQQQLSVQQLAYDQSLSLQELDRQCLLQQQQFQQQQQLQRQYEELLQQYREQQQKQLQEQEKLRQQQQDQQQQQQQYEKLQQQCQEQELQQQKYKEMLQQYQDYLREQQQDREMQQRQQQEQKRQETLRQQEQQRQETLRQQEQKRQETLRQQERSEEVQQRRRARDQRGRGGARQRERQEDEEQQLLQLRDSEEILSLEMLSAEQSPPLSNQEPQQQQQQQQQVQLLQLQQLQLEQQLQRLHRHLKQWESSDELLQPDRRRRMSPSGATSAHSRRARTQTRGNDVASIRDAGSQAAPDSSPWTVEFRQVITSPPLVQTGQLNGDALVLEARATHPGLIPPLGAPRTRVETAEPTALDWSAVAQRNATQQHDLTMRNAVSAPLVQPPTTTTPLLGLTQGGKLATPLTIRIPCVDIRSLGQPPPSPPPPPPQPLAEPQRTTAWQAEQHLQEGRTDANELSSAAGRTCFLPHLTNVWMPPPPPQPLSPPASDGRSPLPLLQPGPAAAVGDTNNPTATTSNRSPSHGLCHVNVSICTEPDGRPSRPARVQAYTGPPPEREGPREGGASRARLPPCRASSSQNRCAGAGARRKNHCCPSPAARDLLPAQRPASRHGRRADRRPQSPESRPQTPCWRSCSRRLPEHLPPSSVSTGSDNGEMDYIIEYTLGGTDESSTTSESLRAAEPICEYAPRMIEDSVSTCSGTRSWDQASVAPAPIPAAPRYNFVEVDGVFAGTKPDLPPRCKLERKCCQISRLYEKQGKSRYHAGCVPCEREGWSRRRREVSRPWQCSASRRGGREPSPTAESSPARQQPRTACRCHGDIFEDELFVENCGHKRHVNSSRSSLVRPSATPGCSRIPDCSPFLHPANKCVASFEPLSSDESSFGANMDISDYSSNGSAGKRHFKRSASGAPRTCRSAEKLCTENGRTARAPRGEVSIYDRNTFSSTMRNSTVTGRAMPLHLRPTSTSGRSPGRPAVRVWPADSVPSKRGSSPGRQCKHMVGNSERFLRRPETCEKATLSDDIDEAAASTQTTAKESAGEGIGAADTGSQKWEGKRVARHCAATTQTRDKVDVAAATSSSSSRRSQMVVGPCVATTLTSTVRDGDDKVDAAAAASSSRRSQMVAGPCAASTQTKMVRSKEVYVDATAPDSRGQGARAAAGTCDKRNCSSQWSVNHTQQNSIGAGDSGLSDEKHREQASMSVGETLSERSQLEGEMEEDKAEKARQQRPAMQTRVRPLVPARCSKTAFTSASSLLARANAELQADPLKSKETTTTAVSTDPSRTVEAASPSPASLPEPLASWLQARHVTVDSVRRLVEEGFHSLPVLAHLEQEDLQDMQLPKGQQRLLLHIVACLRSGGKEAVDTAAGQSPSASKVEVMEPGRREGGTQVSEGETPRQSSGLLSRGSDRTVSSSHPPSDRDEARTTSPLARASCSKSPSRPQRPTSLLDPVGLEVHSRDFCRQANVGRRNDTGVSHTGTQHASSRQSPPLLEVNGDTYVLSDLLNPDLLWERQVGSACRFGVQPLDTAWTPAQFGESSRVKTSLPSTPLKSHKKSEKTPRQPQDLNRITVSQKWKCCAEIDSRDKRKRRSPPTPNVFRRESLQKKHSQQHEKSRRLDKRCSSDEFRMAACSPRGHHTRMCSDASVETQDTFPPPPERGLSVSAPTSPRRSKPSLGSVQPDVELLAEHLARQVPGRQAASPRSPAPRSPPGTRRSGFMDATQSWIQKHSSPESQGSLRGRKSPRGVRGRGSGRETSSCRYREEEEEDEEAGVPSCPFPDVDPLVRNPCSSREPPWPRDPCPPGGQPSPSSVCRDRDLPRGPRRRRLRQERPRSRETLSADTGWSFPSSLGFQLPPTCRMDVTDMTVRQLKAVPRARRWEEVRGGESGEEETLCDKTENNSLSPPQTSAKNSERTCQGSFVSSTSAAATARSSQRARRKHNFSVGPSIGDRSRKTHTHFQTSQSFRYRPVRRADFSPGEVLAMFRGRLLDFENSHSRLRSRKERDDHRVNSCNPDVSASAQESPLHWSAGSCGLPSHVQRSSGQCQARSVMGETRGRGRAPRPPRSGVPSYMEHPQLRPDPRRPTRRSNSAKSQPSFSSSGRQGSLSMSACGERHSEFACPFVLAARKEQAMSTYQDRSLEADMAEWVLPSDDSVFSLSCGSRRGTSIRCGSRSDSLGPTTGSRSFCHDQRCWPRPWQDRAAESEASTHARRRSTCCSCAHTAAEFTHGAWNGRPERCKSCSRSSSDGEGVGRRKRKLKFRMDRESSDEMRKESDRKLRCSVKNPSFNGQAWMGNEEESHSKRSSKNAPKSSPETREEKWETPERMMYPHGQVGKFKRKYVHTNAKGDDEDVERWEREASMRENPPGDEREAGAVRRGRRRSQSLRRCSSHRAPGRVGSRRKPPRASVSPCDSEYSMHGLDTRGRKERHQTPRQEFLMGGKGGIFERETDHYVKDSKVDGHQKRRKSRARFACDASSSEQSIEEDGRSREEEDPGIQGDASDVETDALHNEDFKWRFSKQAAGLSPAETSLRNKSKMKKERCYFPSHYISRGSWREKYQREQDYNRSALFEFGIQGKKKSRVSFEADDPNNDRNHCSHCENLAQEEDFYESDFSFGEADDELDALQGPSDAMTSSGFTPSGLGWTTKTERKRSSPSSRGLSVGSRKKGAMDTTSEGKGKSQNGSRKSFPGKKRRKGKNATTSEHDNNTSWSRLMKFHGYDANGEGKARNRKQSDASDDEKSRKSASKSEVAMDLTSEEKEKLRYLLRKLFPGIERRKEGNETTSEGGGSSRFRKFFANHPNDEGKVKSRKQSDSSDDEKVGQKSRKLGSKSEVAMDLTMEEKEKFEYWLQRLFPGTERRNEEHATTSNDDVLRRFRKLFAFHPNEERKIYPESRKHIHHFKDFTSLEHAYENGEPSRYINDDAEMRKKGPKSWKSATLRGSVDRFTTAYCHALEDDSDENRSRFYRDVLGGEMKALRCRNKHSDSFEDFGELFDDTEDQGRQMNSFLYCCPSHQPREVSPDGGMKLYKDTEADYGKNRTISERSIQSCLKRRRYCDGANTVEGENVRYPSSQRKRGRRFETAVDEHYGETHETERMRNGMGRKKWVPSHESRLRLFTSVVEEEGDEQGGWRRARAESRQGEDLGRRPLAPPRPGLPVRLPCTLGLGRPPSRGSAWGEGEQAEGLPPLAGAYPFVRADTGDREFLWDAPWGASSSPPHPISLCRRHSWREIPTVMGDRNGFESLEPFRGRQWVCEACGATTTNCQCLADGTLGPRTWGDDTCAAAEGVLHVDGARRGRVLVNRKHGGTAQDPAATWAGRSSAVCACSPRKPRHQSHSLALGLPLPRVSPASRSMRKGNMESSALVLSESESSTCDIAPDEEVSHPTVVKQRRRLPCPVECPVNAMPAKVCRRSSHRLKPHMKPEKHRRVSGRSKSPCTALAIPTVHKGRPQTFSSSSSYTSEGSLEEESRGGKMHVTLSRNTPRARRRSRENSLSCKEALPALILLDKPFAASTVIPVERTSCHGHKKRCQQPPSLTSRDGSRRRDRHIREGRHLATVPSWPEWNETYGLCECSLLESWGVLRRSHSRDGWRGTARGAKEPSHRSEEKARGRRPQPGYLSSSYNENLTDADLERRRSFRDERKEESVERGATPLRTDRSARADVGRSRPGSPHRVGSQKSGHLSPRSAPSFANRYTQTESEDEEPRGRKGQETGKRRSSVLRRTARSARADVGRSSLESPRRKGSLKNGRLSPKSAPSLTDRFPETEWEDEEWRGRERQESATRSPVLIRSARSARPDVGRSSLESPRRKGSLKNGRPSPKSAPPSTDRFPETESEDEEWRVREAQESATRSPVPLRIVLSARRDMERSSPESPRRKESLKNGRIPPQSALPSTDRFPETESEDEEWRGRERQESATRSPVPLRIALSARTDVERSSPGDPRREGSLKNGRLPPQPALPSTDTSSETESEDEKWRGREGENTPVRSVSDYNSSSQGGSPPLSTCACSPEDSPSWDDAAGIDHHQDAQPLKTSRQVSQDLLQRKNSTSSPQCTQGNLRRRSIPDRLMSVSYDIPVATIIPVERYSCTGTEVETDSGPSRSPVLRLAPERLGHRFSLNLTRFEAPKPTFPRRNTWELDQTAALCNRFQTCPALTSPEGQCPSQRGSRS